MCKKRNAEQNTLYFLCKIEVNLRNFKIVVCDDKFLSYLDLCGERNNNGGK